MTRAASRAVEPTPAATATSEQAVLAAAARGDPVAVAELVTRHQDRVTRLAHRLLGWRGEVEDVVQNVFVALLNNLAKFRGEARLDTWLYRVTVNQCRRQQRKQSRWLRLFRPGTDRPIAADPARAIGDREQLALVRAAVAALPARSREVVVLRYLEELDITEIAGILGLQRNAVEVRLNRARAQLRALLPAWREELGDEPRPSA